MQGASCTIVIIGGGFCGTVLAANLLRRPPAESTRIVLVERQGDIGHGVAYSPRSFSYLLNVPAGRMSAASSDAAQLIKFARRRLPEVRADSFLPRQLYGEYLQDLLRTAELEAPAHVHLERVHGEATAVHAIHHLAPLLVSIGTRQLLADQVVLACGDPAPTAKAYAADVPGHAAYVGNPHRDECVRPSDRAVLLIGTGLTMVDVAVAAAARNPNVHLIALSRHGLLPQVQQDPVALVLDAKPEPFSRGALLSVRQLVRAVRSLVRDAQMRGGDWREAITRVREMAPGLWRNLNDTERHRFLRHVRVYWDVHRHRMPPIVAEQVERLRRTGQLQVRAGCVKQLCAEGDRIVALWRERGRFDTQELWVDRVVDCSGVDHRLEHTTDVLLRDLLNAGLASPDPVGLGLKTGKNGVLIDSSGQPTARLFYLGPMLRADHWEATAVGELRPRAEELALALSAGPSVTARPPRMSPRRYRGGVELQFSESDTAVE